MLFDDSTNAAKAQVTHVISNSQMEGFRERVNTEVIVVGGSPSGLVTAKELTGRGVGVTIVEENNYLSGGSWLGDLLMNKVTVRGPVQCVLDELGVPYEGSDKAERLYVTSGLHACSTLIKATCDADAKIQNMTEFTGVVLRENDRIDDIVVNWTSVHVLPCELTYVDPITVKSGLILDAIGHDAVVLSKLSGRGVLDVDGIEYARGHNTGMGKTADGERGALGHDSPGHDSMWVSESEGSIVDATGVVRPGAIASGTAVAMVHHLPRMGLTFGAMLLSGYQAVQPYLDELDRDTPDANISGSAPADD